MPDLLSLADELLVLVCEHMSQRDLCNVSLSCKKLWQAALSTLYWSPRCGSDDDDSDSHDMLLRTLTDQPQLGNYVRHLGFYGFHVEKGRQKTAECLARSRNAALVFSDTDYVDELKSQCHHSSDDAIAAMLLYYAPNLESLSLCNILCTFEAGEDRTSPRPLDDSLFMKVIAEATTFTGPRGMPLLSRLTTVILDGAEYLPTWSSPVASVFLRLPTLKTLMATDLGEDPGYNGGWECTARASNLTSLMLWDCDLSTATVAQMLRSCKALESFYWTQTCGDNRPYHDGDVRLQYEDIYPELLAHAESLILLGLHTECSCKHKMPVSDEAPFASWLPFQKLEALFIDESRLVKLSDDRKIKEYDTIAKQLPPNLIDMELFACEMTSDSRLVLLRVAEACKQRPHLKTRVFTPDPTTAELMEEMGKTYPRLDVQFDTANDQGQVYYHRSTGRRPHTARVEYVARFLEAWLPFLPQDSEALSD